MGNIISSPKYTRLEAESLEETAFDCYTEVSSASRNAKITSVSDETFGTANNLISPLSVQLSSELSSSQEETGRDGWIVKRHEKQASATIELCNSSRIFGFDIDTSGFINTCPSYAIIEGLTISSDEKNGVWTTLIQEEPLTENSHNFFQLVNNDSTYSHIRLIVSPGGGIARFRTYGDIAPDWSDKTKEYNLASANHGARIVRWSDTDYANKPNILMGNGTLSAHGWLTSRSRDQDRNDFIIIQLAAAGTINSVIIDSTGFKGNAPVKIRIDGCNTPEDDPYQDVYTQWTPLVSFSDVLEDSVNTFAVVSQDVMTHVRLTIYPDGGLQQIKCFGFLDQKEVDKSSSLLTNRNQSFISHATETTCVAEEEDLVPPSPAELHNISNKKKITMPVIEDEDLFEKTVIEELNGSTTQILTPSPMEIQQQPPALTVMEKEILEQSELAAIEQLNSTTPQISPPATYKELDGGSPVTIVSVQEIVEASTRTVEVNNSTKKRKRCGEPEDDEEEDKDEPKLDDTNVAKRSRGRAKKD